MNPSNLPTCACADGIAKIALGCAIALLVLAAHAQPQPSRSVNQPLSVRTQKYLEPMPDVVPPEQNAFHWLRGIYAPDGQNYKAQGLRAWQQALERARGASTSNHVQEMLSSSFAPGIGDLSVKLRRSQLPSIGSLTTNRSAATAQLIQQALRDNATLLRRYKEVRSAVNFVVQDTGFLPHDMWISDLSALDDLEMLQVELLMSHGNQAAALEHLYGWQSFWDRVAKQPDPGSAGSYAIANLRMGFRQLSHMLAANATLASHPHAQSLLSMPTEEATNCAKSVALALRWEARVALGQGLASNAQRQVSIDAQLKQLEAMSDAQLPPGSTRAELEQRLAEARFGLEQVLLELTVQYQEHAATLKWGTAKERESAGIELSAFKLRLATQAKARWPKIPATLDHHFRRASEPPAITACLPMAAAARLQQTLARVYAKMHRQKMASDQQISAWLASAPPEFRSPWDDLPFNFESGSGRILNPATAIPSAGPRMFAAPIREQQR